MDAAERLFSDRGYEATTTAAIAAGAAVSRGTPLYFFHSKEDLYRAVLGRAFAETSELIRSTFSNSDFEGAISAAVGRYLDFLGSRPNFVKLVVRECLDGGRFLQGLPEHLAALADGISEVGRGTEAFGRDVDVRHLLLSAISMCWFPLVARALTADLGFDPDSPAFQTERKRQVAELLMKGAQAGR